MHLSPEQLRAIMPKCPEDWIEEYAVSLSEVMTDRLINTVVRAGCFLGQLAHESGDLRFWAEQATGEAYEGRRDLGNVWPGDGPRYKGRGPIQLTGRTNYRAAGEALGVDLEARPDLVVLTPAVGFQVAGWFWSTRTCNELADDLDVAGITKRINGGLTGLEQRQACTSRALAVLRRTARLA